MAAECKNRGLWVTAETISKNMWSLRDSSTENSRSYGALYPRHLHNGSAPGYKTTVKYQFENNLILEQSEGPALI